MGIADLTPQQFEQAWCTGADELVVYPEDILSTADLPLDAKAFLRESGLPQSAAPFLMFRAPDVALPIAVTSRGFPIGSTGSGEPIVVSSNGTVCFLDLDNTLTKRYINRSISTLATTLLRFRELTSGGEPMRKNNLQEHRVGQSTEKQLFSTFLDQLDPQALEPDGFWAQEIACWEAEGATE
jgi:hypothetical protein